jgi:hypothetical protein
MGELAQSYRAERVAERVPVLDAPFTCSNPECDEAYPAPAPWEDRGWSQSMPCPACGQEMFRAPFAQAVAREGRR